MIGPDLTKVTNVLPHEGGYNVGTATDSCHKVVMQSDPAGTVFPKTISCRKTSTLTAFDT